MVQPPTQNRASNSKKAFAVMCGGCLLFIAIAVVLSALGINAPGYRPPAGYISEAQGQQVELGMTYDQVVRLLGRTPLENNPGNGGSAMRYELPDDGFLGVMFEGEHVSGVIGIRKRNVLFQKGVVPSQAQIDANTPAP